MPAAIEQSVLSTVLSFSIMKFCYFMTFPFIQQGKIYYFCRNTEESNSYYCVMNSLFKRELLIRRCFHRKKGKRKRLFFCRGKVKKRGSLFWQRCVSEARENETSLICPESQQRYLGVLSFYCDRAKDKRCLNIITAGWLWENLRPLRQPGDGVAKRAGGKFYRDKRRATLFRAWERMSL